jgi:hypothetical protein
VGDSALHGAAPLGSQLIEHHPESDLAGAGEARIFVNDLQPFFPGDPLGYSHTALLRRPSTI